MNKIDLWNVDFNKNFILKKLYLAFKNRNISQGKITEEFEKKLSKVVNLPYVVCTNSGSGAFLLLLLSLKLKKNDEIILPDRTWISDLHAPKILNLKIKLVDVEKNKPLININDLKKKITKNTKVIVAVHLGGRIANVKDIKKIIDKKNITLIEDTSQALGVKNKKLRLGQDSDASFYSFSVAKIVSSGQGGFIATKNKALYKKLILNRSHGVKFVDEQEHWTSLGFNFKFTDIQACLGLGELKTLNKKKIKLTKIYNYYFNAIKNLNSIDIIPVDLKSGEIPLYIEIISKLRKKLLIFLKKKNIASRPFYPSLSQASYNRSQGVYKNSINFSKNALYLPSGPDLKIENIKRVIKILNQFEKKFINEL